MFLLIPSITSTYPSYENSFTFHNVSINTSHRYGLNICLMTLHSTMFLLIHHVLPTLEVFSFSLHSTMFLLILILANTSSVFSTSLHSTMFLLILLFSDGNQYPYQSLHSTMFLLIRGSLLLILLQELYFTFHNVSINTAVPVLWWLREVPLHSTMFLLIH